MPPKLPDYDEVSNRLEVHWDDQNSSDFRAALSDLAQLAEAGVLEAAASVAKILALAGPHRDTEAAYKWYFIALSQQGYSVAFCDANGTLTQYRGVDGDFRNESMVNELVAELGFERVGELDAEALEWLDAHGLRVGPAM